MGNKLIFNCTLDEFVDCLVGKLAEVTAGVPETITKKNYVYSLAGLSKLLGCSISTVARIKKSGVLNAAISQKGKIIVVDADLALDLMNLKKKRKW